MKRFTLLTMLITLLSVTAFAQKDMNLRLLQDSKLSPNPTLKVKATSRHSQPTANRVKGLATTELVTPPEGATTETWYTIAGSFYVGTESGLADYTAAVPTINVAFDGDNVYIQGLAYYFENGWIKGTINGSTVVFESGQLVGEDKYGPEYLVGCDDGENVSESIVFNYDAEKGILASATNYILENAKADSLI